MSARLSHPRIAPVDAPSGVTAAKPPGSNGLPPLNIFLTLAKHDDLLHRFTDFGGFLLQKGLVPARSRELVILRVGWRCNCVYEFGQHTLIGGEAGLSGTEILRLTSETLAGWDDQDSNLIALTDELCAHDMVSTATWERVATRWSEAELIELVVLTGFYRLVCGFLNSTGVQLETDTPGWPDAS